MSGLANHWQTIETSVSSRLGAQMRSNITTTTGHGTEEDDDYDDDNLKSVIYETIFFPRTMAYFMRCRFYQLYLLLFSSYLSYKKQNTKSKIYKCQKNKIPAITWRVSEVVFIQATSFSRNKLKIKPQGIKTTIIEIKKILRKEW